MKSKKMTLLGIILAVAVACMVIYSVVSNVAQKPTITEAEFPFSITYELNGETETIDSVYSAHFVGNGGYAKVTTRYYEGVIDGRDPGDTWYVLSEDSEGTVYLDTKFYADYLMGDPEYDYFDDEAFEPMVFFHDTEYQEHTDKQTLLEHGVKLVSWEYPEPIENSFVFSHIGHLSSDVVLPLALIAALALIAVIVLVRKEEGLEKKAIDRISLILNFVIALTVVPFMTVYGVLSDINGSSPDLSYQLGYLMPAIAILGLAVSVALRRMGRGGASLAVQFVAPVLFALLATFFSV